MLVSGVHAGVRRRGAGYSRDLGDRFTALILRSGVAIDHEDAEGAVRAAFNAVFATLVLRTAYGAEFAGPAVDAERRLGEMVRRYLLR